MKSLVKQRFGRLVVKTEFHKREGAWRRLWCICDCDCGQEASVNSAKLLQGRTKSCGCLKTEQRPPRNSRLKPLGHANRNRVLDNYKKGAARKGLAFTISDEYAFELFQSDCFYCGATPSNVMNRKRSNGEYVYNGIDRMDNEKGYENGNVVPCCSECNFKKSDEHADRFLAWVLRVAEHTSGRGDRPSPATTRTGLLAG